VTAQGSGRLAARGVAARAVFVLMLVVVAASAWLRLAQPRPACADWPACRAGTAAAAMAMTTESPSPGSTPAAAARGLAATRGVHRIAATAVLLLVLGLVVMAWRERAARPDVLRPAAMLLGVALALSALGLATPGSRAGGVLLGNLLGGFVMLVGAAVLASRLAIARPVAASVRSARSTTSALDPALDPALAAGPSLTRLARGVAALWLAQAAFGALSGAGLLHVAPPLHLAFALVALPLAAVVAWRARAANERASRRAGATLRVVIPVLCGLGLASAASSAAPAWVLVHNVTAAIGLAALGVLATRSASASA